MYLEHPLAGERALVHDAVHEDLQQVLLAADAGFASAGVLRRRS